MPPAGRLSVLVTRRLPSPVEDRMRALYDATLNESDTPMTGESIARAATGMDVLVPTVTDRIDKTVIAALPENVRLIANFGVGLDHVDLAAAAARGIAVTNTPDVLTEDTADIALALMLAAARRLGEGERLARAGQWTGWTPTFMMGHRVSGKTLGIVGLGRIGQAVAKRAAGFGMAIRYHGRRRAPDGVEAALGAHFDADLDAMLARVDFLSLNCPLTPETTHLIAADQLARMKKTAILVNTSRGKVVDEAALARALKDGVIAAAGLDVYEAEPAIHPDLIGLENAVIAPHLGSATHEGRIAMGERVIENIEAFARSERPRDLVTG